MGGGGVTGMGRDYRGYWDEGSRGYGEGGGVQGGYGDGGRGYGERRGVSRSGMDWQVCLGVREILALGKVAIALKNELRVQER